MGIPLVAKCSIGTVILIWSVCDYSQSSLKWWHQTRISLLKLADAVYSLLWLR